MSKSVNEITLVGNIGRVERIDANGQVFVRMSVATSEDGYTKSDGTQVPEETQWHTIVAWSKLAEIVLKYIGVGEAKQLQVSKVYVKGKVKYRQVDNQGVKRTFTDIVASDIIMLDKRNVEQAGGQAQYPQGYAPQYPQGYAQAPYPQYPPQPQYPNAPFPPQGNADGGNSPY